MSEPLKPWTPRRGDFTRRKDKNVEPNIGFELFFEYLRLSPSYELARLDAAGGLPLDACLPSDFEDVRKTFRLLGDVQSILYRTWWIDRGLNAFGRDGARAKVRPIVVLRSGKPSSAAKLAPYLTEYLDTDRTVEGLPSVLLLAVPLDRPKNELLRSVAALIEKNAEKGGLPPDPPLKLLGERLRRKELFRGVRLLWMRAAKPKWELWRLGAQTELSPTYSSELDPNGPRKAADENEVYNREMMTKITNRALAAAEAMAENAARGRFPSTDPVEQTQFDYPALARRIRRKNKWEREEKDRLLRELQP